MDERSGAVVALKDLSEAKSRFTSLVPAVRRRLAELMAVTVLRALRDVVDDVVVVTAAPGVPMLLAAHDVDSRCLPDPGRGLNAAFAAGAADLAARGCGLVLACMADLPAVTPAAVAELLSARQGPGRWFVADTADVGTTVLAARGQDLAPCFGADSAARHRRSGAVQVSAAPHLRRDVDDSEDLAEAVRLGLQPPASRLVAGDGSICHDTAVVARVEADGWTLITSNGSRAYASASSAGAELRGCAVGQRVHLVRGDDGVVRYLWL